MTLSKMIMIMELVIFMLIGVHYAQDELACARREGVTSVLMSLPMKSLSEVGV